MSASDPDQNPARLGGGGGGGGGAVKLARTVVAWLTVIVQLAAVPEQPPLHPAKVLPPVAAAVSVNCVPCSRSSPQSPLCDAAEMVHATPEPVTVPVPVPDVPAATVTTCLGGGGGGGGAKFASTVEF